MLYLFDWQTVINEIQYDLESALEIYLQLFTDW